MVERPVLLSRDRPHSRFRNICSASPCSRRHCNLPGSLPAGAYNVALILSAWLSGYFAFLLGRKLTGSALAGAIAGVAFGFCPYRVGQLSHLQVLTAQWMPLALFAMHAYVDDRRRRWLAIFAAAWLLQALSNGYYLLFFPVLIALWLAWFIDWRTDARPGLALGATFALSSLLLVPVLLQYRHVHESMGLARQRGEMLLFSAEPSSFLHMPYALRFWPDTELKTQEDLLFPGVTAIALIIISLIVLLARKRFAPNVARRAPFAFYVLATLAFWWLALGPVDDGVSNLWWLAKPYSFLTLLPGFSGLRVPARFAMLACLTLAIAAALAFARITAHSRRAQGALGAVVLAGLLVDGWPTPVPLHAPPGRVALPDVKDAHRPRASPRRSRGRDGRHVPCDRTPPSTDIRIQRPLPAVPSDPPQRAATRRPGRGALLHAGTAGDHHGEPALATRAAGC